ncbi:MAG: LCP family protein, partial [Chloroflexota bacterium]
MTTNQQAKTSGFGRFLTLIFFRVLPAILLIAIVVSLVQVVNVWMTSMAQNSTTADRRTDYIGTATAIAPEETEEALNNLFLPIQFATNTPMGNENDAQSDASATPVSATLVPTATDSPVEILPPASPTFYNVPEAELETIAGTQVPSRAQLVPRNHNLVNIVLLGSDGDIVGDNSVRTDTIIIVSINLDTGTVSMLDIPRDAFVYVPTPSMQRINAVYGIGEAFGWTGGGFGLLRETIFYNFGIQVHYHALVEISGLVEIIDTLGGVDIAVDCAYQDPPLVDADVPSEAIGPDDENVYILPVGYYNFTGREAMWYVRSRGNSDAFDRGRRQIQLLEAMFRVARDNGQINQLPSLWGELTTIVETDVPLELVVSLLPIANSLDSSRIDRFNLVRWDHTTPWTPSEGNYAGQNVQVLNEGRVFELMNDFYTPPTDNRLSLATASIAVYNGTDLPNLDIVASERLRNA